MANAGYGSPSVGSNRRSGDARASRWPVSFSLTFRGRSPESQGSPYRWDKHGAPLIVLRAWSTARAMGRPRLWSYGIASATRRAVRPADLSGRTPHGCAPGLSYRTGSGLRERPPKSRRPTGSQLHCRWAGPVRSRTVPVGDHRSAATGAPRMLDSGGWLEGVVRASGRRTRPRSPVVGVALFPFGPRHRDTSTLPRP